MTKPEIKPETNALVNGNTGQMIPVGPTQEEVVANLKTYMEAKPKKVFFNGKRYPEFDDWQYIGRFYGLTAKTFDPRFIEIGPTKGFHAKALILNADQLEVGRAEAYCMDDEPNWKRKPLFQLASMSQTRAAAKALSNILRPLAILAGYEGSPSEEMIDADIPERKPDVTPERIKELADRFEPPPATVIDDADEPMDDKVASKPVPDELQHGIPEPRGEVISKKQASLLWVKRTKLANIPEKEWKGFLFSNFGITKDDFIPRGGMTDCLDWIANYPPLKPLVEP